MMHAILHPLAQLMTGVAMLVAFLGTGLLLLRRVKVDCEPSERYLFAFGLGTGAWGMVVFALGATSLLYPMVIAGLVALGVIAAVLNRKMFSPVPVLDLSSLSWIERGLLALLLLHVVFNYVLTFLPPADYVGNDGIAYHLPVPKMYLAHHSFVYIPFIFHSNWPFLAEMLYAVGLAVIPDGTVSVQMHFFAGLACLGAVYRMGGYVVRRRLFRLIAVLSFITLDVMRSQMHSAFIDLFTAMYILLSWLTVLSMRGRFTTGHGVLLLGLFIGFAASTKLTAPLYCLVVPFLAAAPGLSAATVRKLGPKVVLTGVVSLLVVLPWYVKSHLFTGNPFWPFGYAVFGGRYLDAAYAATIAAFFDRYLLLEGLTGFLRLPVEMIERELWPDSPRYLVAAACAGLLTVPWTWRKHDLPLRMTAVFVLWGTIVWFLTSQQIRFLIPFLGLLALVVTAQCELLLRDSGWRRYAGYACAVLIVVPTVYRIPFTNASDYRHLAIATGCGDREEYLGGVEAYRMSVFLNSDVREGERAALIGEVNGFYIDREYIWTGFNTALYFDLNRIPVDRIESRFRQEGISHVVLRRDRKDRELEEPARAVVEEMLARSQLVYSDRWYDVYRLRLR